MTPRRFAALACMATMAFSGAYFFVYLGRWEWNRALVSGAIFLAAEVAAVGALLTDRLRRIDRRLDAVAAEQQAQIRLRLHETAPDPAVSFAWLQQTDRLSVFVPILMGAGAALSAAAWVVERAARLGAQPLREQWLAKNLSRLTLPPGGLLSDDDGLELLRRPATGRRR
jgi:hypothetical protein